VDRELVGNFTMIEAAAAPFEFERGAGWESALLECACGGDAFRLIGWPRAAVGSGGVLWRTFARVFREVRAAMEPPARGESPYLLPLFAACEACGREAGLFDRDAVAGRLAQELRHLPRESLRCRACRRGAFTIGVAVGGAAEGALPRDGKAVEVRARCVACHRTARVAWSDARPSAQAQRLDLLYGRR